MREDPLAPKGVLLDAKRLSDLLIAHPIATKLPRPPPEGVERWRPAASVRPTLKVLEPELAMSLGAPYVLE